MEDQKRTNKTIQDEQSEMEKVPCGRQKISWSQKDWATERKGKGLVEGK